MDKQVIAMRRSPKTYFRCGGITAALVAVIFGLSIWMLTLGSATVAAIVFMVVAVLFAVFVAFTFVYGAHLNRAPKEIIYCEDGTLYVYAGDGYVEAPVSELGEVSLHKSGFSHTGTVALQSNESLELHMGGRTLSVQAAANAEDAAKKLTELKGQDSEA